MEAWGTEAKKPYMFLKMCGLLTSVPQASPKTTWPKKHFGIPWDLPKKTAIRNLPRSPRGEGKAPGPQKLSEAVLSALPRLLEWFLGPPGPSTPQKAMMNGSRKISVHDYMNTKLGLGGGAYSMVFASSEIQQSTGSVIETAPHRCHSPPTKWVASQPTFFGLDSGWLQVPPV